jgi:hypothetical protein
MSTLLSNYGTLFEGVPLLALRGLVTTHEVHRATMTCDEVCLLGDSNSKRGSRQGIVRNRPLGSLGDVVRKVLGVLTCYFMRDSRPQMHMVGLCQVALLSALYNVLLEASDVLQLVAFHVHSHR